MRSTASSLFIFCLLHLLFIPMVSQSTTDETTEEPTKKTPDDDSSSMVKWIGVSAGVIVLITIAIFLLVFCALKKRKDRFMKGQSPAEFGLKDESLEKDELMHKKTVVNQPKEDSRDEGDTSSTRR